MQGIMEIIRTIRNLRSEMNVAPSKRTRLMLLPGEGWQETLAGGDGYFRRLAGASETELLADRNQVTEKTVSAVTAAGELFIPLGTWWISTRRSRASPRNWRTSARK